MVVAGVLYDTSIEPILRKIGVKDSKRLSPKKREILETGIKKTVQRYWINIISVSEMDKRNLNSLEMESFVSIINRATAEKVFIDVPVRESSIKEFVAEMQNSIKGDSSIIARNHADDIYPCVGAASILAKVERDRIIKKLHSIYGDFGSGYPADERTRKFISNWDEFPEIIRKRWLTAREAIVKGGRIMLLGGKDTGKTEMAKELINIGIGKNMSVGVLDIDIGQSHIGPPGSIGFGIANGRIRKLENTKELLTYPIFSLSPSGCENKILEGLKWISKRIPCPDLIVIDTSGYIKEIGFIRNMIQTIKPDAIVLLERENELQDLRKEKGIRIYPIPIYADTRRKSKVCRKEFREKRFSKYHS